MVVEVGRLVVVVVVVVVVGYVGCGIGDLVADGLSTVKINTSCSIFNIVYSLM